MSNHGHLHGHSAEETSPSSLNMLQQQILTLHARGTVASLVSSLRLLESVTLESMVTFNRLGLWRHFLFRWALRSCEHSPSALDDQAIEQLVQKMGKFFPKQYNSTEMGIPAVYPSAINSGKGAREVSMFGHSFDSFYHVCAKASD